MDHLGTLTSGQNAALVVFAFLQADCRGSQYAEELLSLGKDLNLTRDINFNGPRIDALDDGDLETDGHFSSCPTPAIHGIQPSVDLQWPEDLAAAAALQHVAEELRDIADQIERNVVDKATKNLSKSICASPSEQWTGYLTREVGRVMQQGVGLEHLPQERVMVALTLTLVRGVCEQAPRLLRTLFNTALQCVSSGRSR